MIQTNQQNIDLGLRDKLVAAARRATVRHFPQYADPEAASGACLYYTFFLIMEGRRYGVDIIPQAGTHFWGAIVSTQEIIDIQTKFLPLACRRILGFDWIAPNPPNFVWTNAPSELPLGVRYEANKEATMLAWKHMSEYILPVVRHQAC